MSAAEPAPRRRVLVVDDDTALRTLLAEEIAEQDLDIREAGSAEEAREVLFSWGPDLILSDLRLPGADAFDLLAVARSRDPAPAFVLMTAFGSVPDAVRALHEGADDFLTKPLDLDHLRVTVHRALETRSLREEVQRYRQLLGESDFHGMLGQSEGMLRLFETIRQIGRADGPVLVVGGTGSGKELVARALHAEGENAEGPFIPVNCAGIPGELLESELFGHVAGAFTGAARKRKGLFAQAHGGTLLLDEIGEMAMPLQAKLLRAIEEGEVRPVGSDHLEVASPRIVAATHRDLEEAVAEGRFREDLFYRLETFTLQVPPLSARDHDIEILAGHFLHLFSSRLGKSIRGFTRRALATLRGHDYPGNVRELRNAMERAVALCSSTEVDVEDLPERLRSSRSAAGGLAERTTGGGSGSFVVGVDGSVPLLAEVERDYVRWVLDRYQGNKSRAARALGIGRRTLYRKLEEELQ